MFPVMEMAAIVLPNTPGVEYQDNLECYFLEWYISDCSRNGTLIAI